MTEKISTLEMALHYVREWQWAVFPIYGIQPGGVCGCNYANCKSPGKHPIGALVPNGVLDATTDEGQINAWFGDSGQNQNCNIGIATGAISNLIVVDVDSVKGGMVDDLYIGDLDSDTLESTPYVKTGGGLHFYYALPKGVEIKNSASKLGKFIDVRGQGGYVVAPPSTHFSGRTYEFENDATRLLEFPKAWLAKLTEENPNKNAPPAIDSDGSLYVPPIGLTIPDEIKSGWRNDEITRIAGSLRRIGLIESELFAALEKINNRVCAPPLDPVEVGQIAHSVARYAPGVANAAILADVEPEDAEDYENTIKPYLFADFIEMEFEPKDILAFHIGVRDIAIIQAATNAGKTTLLRNVALCMAAGRAFMPFYTGGEPIKIAYFDFENDAQDVQKDLKLMYDVFTDSEKENLKQNLIIIPKGLMNGELFQFNRNEKWANSLILSNNVKFIIVDNVSAAYDLNDENSNAEVTRKVIKPLLKMAYKGNCAFLFAHHYGKGKNELEHAGVHAGRGASALQSLSRTVINMFGDVSKGEPVTIECAKRKSDGGQNYRETFELKDDRWFHSSLIVPPPLKKNAYEAIRDYLTNIIYPNVKTMSEIITVFEDDFSTDRIKKVVVELFKDGWLEKPKHGVYCGKDLSKNNNLSGVVNYHEKDID